MKKLLVANRSEIAIRVFRSATELGLRTVAIYSQEDRLGVHRFKADEAYLVGRGKGPVAAYLDGADIVALAREKGVDCIHPGYGFLAENAGFARACATMGITFVGPRPELLDLMGDKTAARRRAQKIGVPVLPGTDDPVSEPAAAAKLAREIGFPLIIKAAFGGGGRGMRVVPTEEHLRARLQEAQDEAATAFGNPAVFLERYLPRAKHIEVQILGDQHGNVVHLHERDCSVQRRHQKVIEIAPSLALPDEVREALCDAAVRLAREIRYDNAGTIEFLLNADDPREWYFIEMNPRIQVEHTVTEIITGVDLVRAQILVAGGCALGDPELDVPAQPDMPRIGYAVQCRVTTEDPANKFTPDYGRILNYRSAAGLGIRLDGAMGDTGSVITPFYDSLLVKVTAYAPKFPIALQRMDRALREFRIRGVKTNIPFLENVIQHPVFRAGQATTNLIDTTPALLEFKTRRDRATRLLACLGDVIVNGNPQIKGRGDRRPAPPAATSLFGPSWSPEANPPVPDYDRREPPPPGTRDLLKRYGPREFVRWILAQERLLITDTTFRDAHQSLVAARVRTYDMLAVADALARRAPGLFSLECWGGATFDTALRFLHEDPYQRLALLRERIPNLCFQMLLRGANGVGYNYYPDNVIAGFVRHAAAAGVDLFRVFDSLNYVPNMRAALDAVLASGALCEAAICYTGDLLDPRRDKYSLRYYVKLAKELEKLGVHLLAIKDMAGLCRPFAADKLVRTLKAEIGIPLHFHTHDTSGIAAASVLAASAAGVDVVDLAIAAMSGSTSQPNLNSIVAALEHTPRETFLDLNALNEFSRYWEAVRKFYAPFDSGPRTGSAEVYLHEMPGGQYTNLIEQAQVMGLGHRWPEIMRTYAEVNQLFGDIVKVTPSSKVVGDMTLFLVSRGIRPADVLNLEPGSTPFPASVVDMLAGSLGRPPGGWPRRLQKAVLGTRRPLRGRPGAGLPPVNLEDEKAALREKYRQEITDADLYCHLMYPEVYAEFVRFRHTYDDVTMVPTSAFFYGLQPGEETSVEIEPGKTLFIKLVHVGAPDPDGYRTVLFELNGRPRETVVFDRSAHPKTKPRALADPGDPRQIGAPIPGMIATLAVSVGAKVARGDRLLTLEAMKMQSSVYAPADGVVEEVAVQVGDSVQSKDLLIRLRRAK